MKTWRHDRHKMATQEATLFAQSTRLNKWPKKRPHNVHIHSLRQCHLLFSNYFYYLPKFPPPPKSRCIKSSLASTQGWPWVGYGQGMPIPNPINLSMDTQLPYPNYLTQLVSISNCYPVCLPMDIHTLPKPNFYKITKYTQKPLKIPKYPQNL